MELDVTRGDDTDELGAELAILYKLVSLYSTCFGNAVSVSECVGFSMGFSPQYPGLVGPGRAVERKLINLLFIRKSRC